MQSVNVLKLMGPNQNTPILHITPTQSWKTSCVIIGEDDVSLYWIMRRAAKQKAGGWSVPGFEHRPLPDHLLLSHLAWGCSHLRKSGFRGNFSHLAAPMIKQPDHLAYFNCLPLPFYKWCSPGYMLPLPLKSNMGRHEKYVYLRFTRVREGFKYTILKDQLKIPICLIGRLPPQVVGAVWTGLVEKATGRWQKALIESTPPTLPILTCHCYTIHYKGPTRMKI